MVDYDNSGRIKDLFQTFPQALNHEIDDLHRGLLAHFFFLILFSLPVASWSVATLATHLFPSPKYNLTPLRQGLSEEQYLLDTVNFATLWHLW